MKVVPVADDIVGLLSGIPSLNSCTSTISKGRSVATIAKFNSKVQVKVTSDPTITTLVLPLLLVKMREDGVGTMQAHLHTIIIMNNNQIINTHFES